MVQIYVPSPMDAISAFEAGQKGAMTRRKDQASRQIGGLMASGDYKGASAAAYGAGEYGTGLQLEKLGSEQRSSERRRGYGEQFAAGKGKEAVTQAYGAGDFEIAGDLQKAIDAASEAEKATMKAKATRIAQLVAPLGDIPDIAARKAYINQNAAALIEAGYTQEQLATFEPTDANLAPIYAEALGLEKYLDYREKRYKPDWKEQKNADGSTVWVDFNDRNGGQPQSQASGQYAGGAGFEAHIPGVLQREGGFVASDGDSGAPANFGINQRANPDIDVKNLTEDGAKQIYKQRYWDAINGDQLPPEAQAAVFDSAVNQGVGAATEMWNQSGGDVRKFNELRLARYRQTKGYDKYGKVWERRVAETTPQSAPRMAAAAPQMGAEPVLAGGSGNDAIQPYQVASMGATPAPPTGPRTRQGSAAPRPEWQDQPDGSQVNIRTGERKGDRTGAGGYTPKQTNEATVELKGKFEGLPHVKAFRDVQASYAVISSIAKKKEPTAADDLSLIFSYMKMLDPGSVVREGEFANAQNTGGVPDVVVNAYNKALSGNRLNARQRNDFANTAGQIVIDRRGQFDATATEYRRLAQDVGANPDRIAPDPSTWKAKAEAAKKAAPAVSAAPANKAELVKQARDAIAKGAPRAAVIQRLRQQGVDTKGI